MTLASNEGRANPRRTLGAILVAAMLAVSCGDSATEGAPTRIPLHEVRAEVRTFVDVARSTPANGEFAGEAERRLDTHLWYADRALGSSACRGGRCGLVLLAHGYGGRAERFDSIGQRLAAAGYVVAAVTFPLTNQDAPGGFVTGISDVIAQPGDLSFVLDALVAASRDPGDVLYQRIDADRVAAVGHSLGGATLAAASRVACCRDSRFGATVYVEPVAFAVEGLFGGAYTAAGPPTLTFQGEIDVPVPVAESRAFHAALATPKILVEMVGGNHVNMIERLPTGPDPLLSEAAEIMIAFFDAYLMGGPDRLDAVAARLRDNGHSVRHDTSR